MKKSESNLWKRIKNLKLKGQLFRIESEELISKTSLSNDLPERKKSSSKKILYIAGTSLVAGGLAYFYINQSDEEGKTGSVSIAIEIPN